MVSVVTVPWCRHCPGTCSFPRRSISKHTCFLLCYRQGIALCGWANGDAVFTFSCILCKIDNMCQCLDSLGLLPHYLVVQNFGYQNHMVKLSWTKPVKEDINPILCLSVKIGVGFSISLSHSKSIYWFLSEHLWFQHNEIGLGKTEELGDLTVLPTSLPSFVSRVRCVRFNGLR